MLMKQIFDVMLKVDPLGIAGNEDYHYVYEDNATRIYHHVLANLDNGVDVYELIELSEFNLHSLCDGIIEVNYDKEKHEEMIKEALYYFFLRLL